VTDEDLVRLSERNPGYQFERTADGRVAVTPTGGESGHREAELVWQLKEWNRNAGLGYVFSPSTGFLLPDGAVFSPDASWVRRDRWGALTPEEREGIVPLCPDAAFEVRSRTQALEELREKMRAYIRNGAQVAVLIDPYRRAAEVYWPAQDRQAYENPGRVGLDPELPGFELELEPIFEG
jgi:Uma2 family endonuclease